MYQKRTVTISIRFMLIVLIFICHAAGSRKCTIKQLVGAVKIRRGSSQKWSNARPKMPLKESDALRTYMESEAELVTSEGSVIKIGENTTIELDQLIGDKSTQETKLKILNGAVLANVKKLVSTKSKFEFETPTATAAIRGTIVGLEVNKEQTKVKVYEGKVWVVPQGSKKGAEIQPNQMGVVKKGNKSVAVEKMDEKIPVSLSAKPADSVLKNDSLPTVPDSLMKDSLNTVDTTDTSGLSSTTSAPRLLLSLSSPTEGAVYGVMSQITVSGVVTPADAVITINGKQVSSAPTGQFRFQLTTDETIGDMEITVHAENQGVTKTLTRIIKVQNKKLQLVINTPVDGQEFKKPLIPVSGTSTPGAEVNVISIKLPVAPNGMFNGQVPIANESGEYYLEFEATLGEEMQKITRNIVYKPDYRFILSSPSERQTVTTTLLTIKGEVLPANAEVSVLGRQLPVSSSGQFSGVITIPNEEGEVFLEFEINAPGLNKNEQRKIIYKRPPDVIRPQISASVAKSCWSVTVFDRTIDEEITLWSELDGVKDSRIIRPNESTCIPFEEGIHTYSVYAEDLAGNISSTETLNKFSFLSGTSWLIRMRTPSGNTVVDLPPASPIGEQAILPVELSIEKLPDDNMDLIHEVVITNKSNGRKVTVRTFTDNFISAEIELARNKVNLIQVDVRDINSVVKSQALQVHVR